MKIVGPRVKALIEAGYMSTIDAVIALILLMETVTVAYWLLFGEPTGMQLLGCALVWYGIIQLWVLILAYRAIYFVLMARADINTMPASAARLALRFSGASSK